MAKEYNLIVQHIVSKIWEGWVGKLKGSFQSLYKHWWMNLEKVSLYTKNWRDEPDDTQYSIKSLMEHQEDFVQELANIQYHTLLLMLMIQTTPK